MSRKLLLWISCINYLGEYLAKLIEHKNHDFITRHNYQDSTLQLRVGQFGGGGGGGGGSQAPTGFITNVIYLVQFSKQNLKLAS